MISVTSGTVVNGGDFENTTGAVSNAGTISLTGSYTNADTTDGNGTYNIAGNLTISGGTFDLGTGTANRTLAGGALSLSLGAALKLGGSSGGVAGSNFPANFTAVTLNGTVEFNGSGAQTIPAFNYTNLTSSSTGARTLASSGTIGVSGTFTPGTNAYTITGSTVDFNGFGAQTIPAFNYNNLTISGGRTTNSVTLVNGGTIGIAGSFTSSATFTSGAYVITGNTVDYNGTGAQTVIAFNYNNLTVSGARTTNSVTLASTGTIGVAGIFNPVATFTSGGYVTTGSTVNFNGTSAQTVASFTYNNLTVSNAVDTSATNYKTAANTLTVGGTLTINAGNTLDMGSFASSTFGGSSTNSGKIRWSADNVYVGGTGTTEFYSSSAANIAAGSSYGNLWFTGTGTKTIPAGISVTAVGGNVAFGVTVSHNLTVASTATLTVTSMDLNNNGTITNGGTISVNQ